jgi:hypothetical protein
MALVPEKPGFLHNWGWPIMGALAAAPILAHALDWRRRAEAKQKMNDERIAKLQGQLTQAQGLVPTGKDVYKAAAFARKLAAAPGRGPEEKLDTIQTAMLAAKRQAARKGNKEVKGTPTVAFRETV